MPARITFSKLVARIQSGNVRQDELESYFVPFTDPDRPHLPAVAIREDQVDIRGIEGAARLAASRLYWDAVKRPAGAVARGRARAAAPSIVAEGDSWFRLPGWWFPNTMIDYLSQSVPVRNIAYWGHEFLADIVREGEYAYHINSNLKFLVLSGGGNDFIGNVNLYIHQRGAGDNNPENAAIYVKHEFHELIDKIHAEYRSIATLLVRLAPRAFMLVHGYDYPKPQRRGGWLAPRLKAKGFHPRDNDVITNALLRVMIDEFNDMLALLAQEFLNVVYVNFRRKVGENFADELHPNNTAAAELAQILLTVIQDPEGSRAIPVG